MLINYKDSEYYKNSSEDNKEGYQLFINGEDGVNDVIKFWNEETGISINNYEVDNKTGDVLLSVPRDVFITYDNNDNELLCYPTLNINLLSNEPITMACNKEDINVLFKYNYYTSKFDSELSKGDMYSVGCLIDDWHVVGYEEGED